MTEYLQALETSVGGPATLHIYTLERSGGSGGFGHGYGLREFMGQSRTVTGPDGVPPAYKYDAVLTKIEALNAAA